MQLSPLIEQQYKDLTRDYQTALDFYKDLLGKKKQSEMSSNLEIRQQSEQFRVLDAPDLPQRPSYPNRQLYAAGGMGGGLVLGLGIALLLEMRDKSLRTDRDVEFFLKLPALAMVPTVGKGDGEKKSFFWKRAKKDSDPFELHI